MSLVALWISLTLALLTFVAAIAKGALEADPDEIEKAESLSFVRLTLTGIFGVLSGELLAPLSLDWWWSVTISIGLMLTLLLGTQLASSRLGHRRFATKLTNVINPVVN